MNVPFLYCQLCTPPPKHYIQLYKSYIRNLYSFFCPRLLLDFALRSQVRMWNCFSAAKSNNQTTLRTGDRSVYYRMSNIQIVGFWDSTVCKASVEKIYEVELSVDTSKNRYISRKPCNDENYPLTFPCPRLCSNLSPKH